MTDTIYHHTLLRYSDTRSSNTFEEAENGTANSLMSTQRSQNDRNVIICFLGAFQRYVGGIVARHAVTGTVTAATELASFLARLNLYTDPSSPCNRQMKQRRGRLRLEAKERLSSVIDGPANGQADVGEEAVHTLNCSFSGDVEDDTVEVSINFILSDQNTIVAWVIFMGKFTSFQYSYHAVSNSHMETKFMCQSV